MEPSTTRVEDAPRAWRSLWRRPWWLDVHPLAAAWLAAVVYGTLIPFEFRVPHAIAGADGRLGVLAAWITSPRWTYGDSGGLADALVNLLLFMPLGALLGRVLERWGVRDRRALPVLFSVLFTITWCIESTQGLIAHRVASAHDAMLNLAGGMIGAMLGPRVYETLRAAVFWLYRRSAPVWFAVGGFVMSPRRRQWVMLTVVGVNIGVIVAWYVTTAPGPASPTSGASGGGGWVPFLRQFELPYSMAAAWIGRSLVVYFIVGTLMALLLLRVHTSHLLLRLMFAVVLVAAIVEQFQRWHAPAPGSGGAPGSGVAPGSFAGDVTEPILAGLAAAMVLSTLTLGIRLLRLSCRRHTPAPVDHDRRRRRHDYAFALRR